MFGQKERRHTSQTVEEKRGEDVERRVEEVAQLSLVVWSSKN